MSNFDPNDVLSNLEIVEAYNTLENNLGSLQAYQNLGISLAKQGLLSEALACYRRILAFKYQEIDNSFGENGLLFSEICHCFRKWALFFPVDGMGVKVIKPLR